MAFRQAFGGDAASNTSEPVRGSVCSSSASLCGKYRRHSSAAAHLLAYLQPQVVHGWLLLTRVVPAQQQQEAPWPTTHVLHTQQPKHKHIRVKHKPVLCTHNERCPAMAAVQLHFCCRCLRPGPSQLIPAKQCTAQHMMLAAAVSLSGTPAAHHEQRPCWVLVHLCPVHCGSWALELGGKGVDVLTNTHTALLQGSKQSGGRNVQVGRSGLQVNLHRSGSALPQ